MIDQINKEAADADHSRKQGGQSDQDHENERGGGVDQQSTARAISLP